MQELLMDKEGGSGRSKLNLSNRPVEAFPKGFKTQLLHKPMNNGQFIILLQHLGPSGVYITSRDVTSRILENP